MVPDISKFKTDIWQICYSQSQKFQELGFTNNPYTKGGERENWDPLSGEERRPKTNHMYSQPSHYSSNSHNYHSSQGENPHQTNHQEMRGDTSSLRNSGNPSSGF
ncbi:uncharacterized protein PGTG_13728 [Puccinia graminis f. sp. tritici CRL 75-36-700-3]|uniref:Uncharacterized protein n=1 Tax=Puccinia graminis f. sp. tritici (strain CRL 75-36-700-3 / race SCCL) TaxID=418459 RepID=E3KUH4_PUCGT|nr:uncharacterized protein PGTG_13728 [Puccinia graminis f. sp. tritici CRL 75-36-700-3]EFP87924.1 hypothetical protein PGTG_13728 [Puccinia graminis f. sp. tritici CRL 75-36-700-3]